MSFSSPLYLVIVHALMYFCLFKLNYIRFGNTLKYDECLYCEDEESLSYCSIVIQIYDLLFLFIMSIFQYLI